VRVLFVEDDPLLVRALKTFFRRQPQYDVGFATTGEEALRMFDAAPYALVVIDWNLPEAGPSGLEICRIIRHRPTSNRPGIIFVTGRDSIDDKLRAFEAGADDYLVKPFDARELTARLESLSRRSTPAPPAVTMDDGTHLVFGPIAIDLTTQIVLVGSREILLPKQQLLILVHLVRRAGQVASERELRENVLRTSATHRSSSVRNLMRELRRQLGVAGELVQSVYGIGYRIADPQKVRKK
jgi:DNA-binding response OmpR family regulator